MGSEIRYCEVFVVTRLVNDFFLDQKYSYIYLEIIFIVFHGRDSIILKEYKFSNKVRWPFCLV